MSRGLRILLAGCLALPLVISLVWGALSQTYPVWDPARYFFFGGLYHFKFVHQGLLEFLRASYALRGWKPIILCPLGGLSLLITHGNVLRAILLTEEFFFAIFLVFSFLTLNLALPLAESAAGALLLGLLPCFNQSSHYFGTEMPSLALTAGTLYWLCRCWKAEPSRGSRGRALAFGFFLGLDLCIRPDQPAAFLLIPLLAWLGSGLKSKFFRLRDLAACSLSLSPFVYLFWKAPPVISGMDSVIRILLICAPAVVFFAFRKKIGLNSLLSTVFTTSYLVMSVWYAPFLQYLHEWIFYSGFGKDLATFEVNPASKAERLFRIGWELGGIPLVLLVLGAGMAAISVKRSKIPRLHLHVLLIGTLTVIFPPLLSLSSFNPTIRYYFASTYLAGVLLLVVALLPVGGWRRARQAMVFVALLYCLGWNMISIGFPGYLKPVSAHGDNDYLSYGPSPNRNPDPAVAFVESLREQFPATLPGERRIAILPLTVPGKYQVSGDDPFRFTNIALERDRRWEFSHFTFDWENPRIFLVGPTEGKRIDLTPASLHAERILSTPPKKLPDLGLTSEGDALLRDGDVKGHFRIYLRQSNSPLLSVDGRAAQWIDALKSRFSEQLGSARKIGLLIFPSKKQPGRFEIDSIRLDYAASYKNLEWNFFHFDPKNLKTLQGMDFYVVGPLGSKNQVPFDWKRSGLEKIAEFTAKDEDFSARFLLLK